MVRRSQFTGWLIVVGGLYALAPVVPQSAERQTLEHALWLAGSGTADLPIELTSAPFAHTSRGLEPWTVLPNDGRPPKSGCTPGAPRFGVRAHNPNPTTTVS
jgi:hypothetical protein